jgi:cell wall-associated NlpC family hydrolase
MTVGRALPLALLVAALLPTAAEARLGDRTLRLGSHGSDVRQLQRALTSAGWETDVDGEFGRGTRRNVKRFEREEDRRVDGVVTRSDARALRLAAERDANEPEDLTNTDPTQPAPVTPGSKATISNGLAIPPADAPPEVKAVIAAGNRIAKKPYKYGGGHARLTDTGYDCSGSMSYALRKAGLLDGSLDSSGFMRFGEPGRGTWITIRANRGHSYMMVAGLRFDTSGARARGGSRWTTKMRSARGYRGRHPEGF